MSEYGNAVVVRAKANRWRWKDMADVVSVLDYSVKQTEKALAKTKGIPDYKFNEVEFSTERRNGNLVAGWKAWGA